VSVVLGFASMDGFHIESMTQHQGDAFFSTDISQPVPAEDALYPGNHILTVRSQRLQQGFWACSEVLMEDDFPCLIQDTQVHGAGVQVDPAIELVLLGVEFYEASSLMGFLPP